MWKFWNSIKCLILFFVIGIFWFQNFSFWVDLMEQVFDKALDYDYVLEIWGREYKSVWRELLQQGGEFQAGEIRSQVCLDPETNSLLYVYQSWQKLLIKNESDCTLAWWIWRRDFVNAVVKPPLIVRITKLLLRITMVLAITMVIFNSVKLMIEVLSWKVELKSSGAKKNLVNIILWVLIALFSVTIINLIISIPKSSVNTSSDYTNIINN